MELSAGELLPACLLYTSYFVSEKEEGNNYLLFYHEFPFSKAKVEYFWNSIAKCNFRTVLFPWYEYSLGYELSKVEETFTPVSYTHLPWINPTDAEFKTQTWPYQSAIYMFDNNLAGSCYGIASAVAACARVLGYEPYVIATTGCLLYTSRCV